MRLHSLLVASFITAGLVTPAAAQFPEPHRYDIFIKYTDKAIIAMAKNPQDRSAQAKKLYESLYGKLEADYFFPLGGEWDGMLIVELPDDVALKALDFMTRQFAAENFTKLQALPLMTSAEFTKAMQMAKSAASTYTPPAAPRP